MHRVVSALNKNSTHGGGDTEVKTMFNTSNFIHVYIIINLYCCYVITSLVKQDMILHDSKCFEFL